MFRRMTLSWVVAELVIGKAGELPIPDAAISLARFLEALADQFLVVELAGPDGEQRSQEIGLDDFVSFEREVADLVAPPFGDRDAQLDVPVFLSLESLRNFCSGTP